MYIQTLAIEAFVVGGILAIVHHLISHIQASKNVPPMMTMFAIGVMTHLLFEAVGANRWYCRHGAACLRET